MSLTLLLLGPRRRDRRGWASVKRMETEQETPTTLGEGRKVDRGGESAEARLPGEVSSLRAGVVSLEHWLDLNA
jgi:hypothetical protein